MTNEELAARIQAGERDQLPALWEQVERFVAMQAYRVARAVGPRAGVTAEDLYQAGYLALVEAVDGYDAERGASFIGYLSLCLKNAFAEAGGWRGSKRDPLQGAVSLSAPLDDDGDGGTLGDMIADPTDPFTPVEATLWHQQLREVLDPALDALPDGGGDLLRKRYLQGQTIADLAQAAGRSPESIRQRELKAILNIKSSHYGHRLYSFVEGRTDYYRHVGARRFNTTHTSAVEALVLRREELTAAFNKRNGLEGGDSPHTERTAETQETGQDH